MSTSTRWHGALTLGHDWAMWHGAVGDTTTHRHFAAQAVIGPQSLSMHDEQGVLHTGSALFIDPLQAHRLLPAAQATIVFIEPRRHPAIDLPVDVVQALHDAKRLSPASGFWADWPRQPANTEPSDPWEQIVREAIDSLLPQGAIGIAEIAQRVHLSSERLRHVFPERVGMGFRRFVLWRRLWRAGQCLKDGTTVTEAAHQAGFADAAHFARTLRSTFGISASQAHLSP